jgi:hypothetical protein
MATTELSMKLLIDTKERRVLFAEASKDVVDFLFSLLSLPVGTVVKLLGKEAMVGSVGRLYASVEKLDATYLQAGAAKDALLHPTVFSAAVNNKSSPLGLPPPPSPQLPQPKTFYRCHRQCNSRNHYGQGSTTSCHCYITDIYQSCCPTCNSQMTTELTLVPSARSGRRETISRRRRPSSAARGSCRAS